jgi:hypothetical protein
VRNGAYGERRYGLRSTDLTAKSALASRPASAPAASPSRCRIPVPRSCPAAVKSRPCATRCPSTETSVAPNEFGVSVPGRPVASSVARVLNSASRSQYWAARKAIRSRSRSTTSRVATDWTRPADSRGMTFFHSTGETSYPYSRSSTRRAW